MASKLQKTWEKRINNAVAKRADWAKQFRVEMAREYFEGKQNPGFASNEWLTINKIYSHLMAQLPNLYAVDPYFYVKLRRSYVPDPNLIAAYERRGKIRQAMLNYLKSELELKKKARLGIQDAHFAYGVVKVHYKADMKENANAGEGIKGENGEYLEDDEGNYLIEPEEIPVNERYVISRIHPDDFVFDEHAGPLADSWRFVAERVRMTKAEARADKTIRNAALKEAEIGDREADSKQEKVSSKDKRIELDTDDDNDVYTIWEIYDLKEKEWLKIAEGAKTPVMPPEPLPEGVECDPYAVLRFTLRDRSAYPIPPISQGLDAQREYNEARSKVLVHRKRFNRKYEVFEPGLEDADTEVAKLEAGDDGTIIRKSVAQQVVTTISDAPLDPQHYTEIGALNNDLIELLGSSDNARGIAKADSATEAALIDKRMEVREGDMLSDVIDWVSEIARKLDQLVQANITQDEAIRITGPQGEAWEIVRVGDYDEIAGEFEYTVNIGATTPRLPQVERAQWLAFLQVLGSFPQLLTVKPLLKRVAEMHHIEDDQMIDQLVDLGKTMMQQSAAEKGIGPLPGSAPNNPITAAVGMAMGDQGGVVGGGGTPGIG